MDKKAEDIFEMGDKAAGKVMTWGKAAAYIMGGIIVAVVAVAVVAKVVF